MEALRRHLLLARAQALGCGRLALGDSGTRLAVRIVAGASKGAGFSLPGDVQAADARCARYRGFFTILPFSCFISSWETFIKYYRACGYLTPWTPRAAECTGYRGSSWPCARGFNTGT